MITANDLRKAGGEWLTAARSWLQWHKRNGARVTWGSQEVLEPPMTVREVEDVAAAAAAAALHPIVKLYWEMEEAEEHYQESAEAKRRACGLAQRFHDLMATLRPDSSKPV